MKIEELEELLDLMAEKGSINSGIKIDDSGEEKFYANALLIVGIFEYQLNKLSKELIEDFEQYVREGFLKELSRTKIPQLRTIPIEQSITPEHEIATYDQLREIIDNIGGPISIANCICKQAKDILGKPCKQTSMREVCFQFRTAAKTYMEKGLSREITREEALKILDKAESDGLVIQPGNSLRPNCICCCCGCCCELLSNFKKLPAPAEFFATNFHAEVNPEVCSGCGTCVNRCQMDALSIVENISTVNLKRCIGCGLCVPTCPMDAITLVKNDDERVPPKDTITMYRNIMDKKAELVRAGKH